MACAMPALVLTRSGAQEEWSGAVAVTSGCLGPFFGQFAWFANLPAGIAAVLLFRRRYNWAIGWAATAILIAIDSLALFHQPIPSDEGNVGPPYILQHFGPGFFLWLASLGVLFLGALVLRIREKAPIAEQFRRT
jgi:hypothetical protein